MSAKLHSDNSGPHSMVIDLGAPFSVIPMRDSMVFPGSTTPLLLGREMSVRAAEYAREKNNGFVFLALQKDLEREDITEPGQLYEIGLVARIQNIVFLPNGYAKTLVEGVLTAKGCSVNFTDGVWFSLIEPLPYIIPIAVKSTVLRQKLLTTLHRYAEATGEIPSELLQNLEGLAQVVDVVNTVMPFVKASFADRQRLLECTSLADSVDLLCTFLDGSLEMQGVQNRVEQDVRHRLQQNQREWFIHEQIRVLQDELESPDIHTPEMKLLDKRIREKKLPPLVEEKVREEFSRMPQLHPSTPEYSVVRNFLDWVLALPFGEYTPDLLDLRKVRKELDSHHYGLEKVKERILEHVAVLKLAQNEKRTPILCLAGPPGVGKTSLAKSIADAMGRNFVRITLGGVRDEAEIRGHRRTYIGSMPGRIIQALRKAKSMNPVILLDEIDKMSTDFRGDPSSALLEVLDPEQNQEFQDHYLEAGIDLSRVLFIATANMEDRIPQPLHDRMEIVRLTGYHQHEKHEIMRKHLFQRVSVRNGLADVQIEIPDETLDSILNEYTREAGVRDLERQLDHLCRKRAMEVVSGKKFKVVIAPADLSKYLGVPPYHRNRLLSKATPGVITGLAYTSVGGEILQIECTLLSGRGRMLLTGTLGDVMKESAQIALTLVRQRASRFGIDPEVFRKTDIHIHIPEGAVPKDGPSAGIALTLVLLSAVTRQPVPPEVAFTGEVSLTGRLHAIGGLTEKSIAALQAGVTTLHLPADNEKQIAELPVQVRKGLVIHRHEHIDEIIKVLFVKPKLPKGAASDS
jgi:ATP-dependent Lon protease